MSVLNFAVHPDYRRQGVGASMATKLLGKLHLNRRSDATLMVRESNLAAQQFWKSQGFAATGIIHGFYSATTDEDAYIFRYRLAGAVPQNRMTGMFVI